MSHHSTTSSFSTMKKSFAARRVPRRIAGDEDEEPSTTTSPAPSSPGKTTPQHRALHAPSLTHTSANSRLIPYPEPSTVVKRPSVKARKSSNLRASFAAAGDDEEDSGPSVITPKRGNLSRLAIQRNAEKKGNDLPFRAGRDEDERPSYSKDYLAELKQSTPTTPANLSASSTDVEDEAGLAQGQLDIASKFGADLSRYSRPTAIPTDAEIKEKKERRARLAKENDFIALDASDEDDEDLDENVTRDETGRLILKPKEKYPETRLVRDDEDILEDFDDFTTDGKMALGRKAEKEAAAKRKAEMASLIADAEGQDSEEDEDDSEAERNAAFEVAQTRHGNYAHGAEDRDTERPRTPPRIAPLPSLDAVVERLRKRLEEMEVAKMGRLKEMQALKEEKLRIGEEEVRVQASLKETGEKYAKLREEMGLKDESDGQVAVVNGGSDDMGFGGRGGLGGAGLGSTMGRGLDSLGGTPIRATSVSSSE